MQDIKRRAIASITAVIMCFYSITTYATELVTSTNSSFANEKEGYEKTGEDVVQDKVASSSAINNIANSTYSEDSDAYVYATRKSNFNIIIPKTIILDGDTKKGNYQVAIKGEITGGQQISINTPDNISFHEKNALLDKKEDVLGYIYGAKTLWNQAEIKPDTYDGTGTTIGTILAEDISAGSWVGTTTFYINCYSQYSRNAAYRLSTDKISLMAGNSLQVNAFEDEKNANDFVLWESNNPDITVYNGIITAADTVPENTSAIITATFPGNSLKKAIVKVDIVKKDNTENIKNIRVTANEQISLSENDKVTFSKKEEITGFYATETYIQVPTTVENGSQYQATIINTVTNEKTLLNIYVDALDAHEHYFVCTSTKEKTCEQNGYNRYICYCNETYDDIIPATGHNYEQSIIEATYTSTGENTYLCSTCGDTYTETIPRLETAPVITSATYSIGTGNTSAKRAVTFSVVATDKNNDTLTYKYDGSTSKTLYYGIGTHTVTVSVSDGTYTTTKDVTFTIANTAPATPTINVVPYTDNNTVKYGRNVTLTASSSDTNGDAIYYEWSGRTAETATYSVGTHTVKVRAYDAFGAYSSWASYTFTVKSTPAVTLSYTDSRNVFNVVGNSSIKTTYNNTGYSTMVSINGGTNTTMTAASQTISNVTITRKTWYDDNSNYVKTSYTVYNGNASSVSMKLGVHADIQINTNDSAPLTPNSTGFKMSDGTYDFYALLKNTTGVTNVDTIWLGKYSSRTSNIWNNNYVSVSGMDSGMAFSWQRTLAAYSTNTYTFYLSIE